MILDSYKDLLSASDFAEIFDTTKNTIYKEIQRGTFGDPIKIGRKYRVSKKYVSDKFFSN